MATLRSAMQASRRREDLRTVQATASQPPHSSAAPRCYESEMWSWLRRRRRNKPPTATSEAPVVCECVCHRNPLVVHVMPCCKPCPVCGQRFARGLREHLRESGPSHIPPTSQTST